MNVEINMSNVVLHTERLILRPWRQSDLDDLYAYASVDGVGQMAGWKPHENKEESQQILNMFIEQKKTFALEYQGKVIGSLGIETYHEEQFPEFAGKKCREIGYVLSKNYWGQGLMPEAVREVIRYLFEEVGLDVVFCGHFLWNQQSQRAQEKCGFKHYADNKFETSLGTVEDNEVSILTRERWIWGRLYHAAKAVQNGRKISDYVEAGGVSAAVLSSSGRIYTGICVDTCSTLGICAERNAIFNMLTNGEQEILKVLAIMPNGKAGAPCGACRELMVQLMPEKYKGIEIMLDYEQDRTTTLGELTPEWWI